MRVKALCELPGVNSLTQEVLVIFPSCLQFSQWEVKPCSDQNHGYWRWNAYIRDGSSGPELMLLVNNFFCSWLLLFVYNSRMLTIERMSLPACSFLRSFWLSQSQAWYSVWDAHMGDKDLSNWNVPTAFLTPGNWSHALNQIIVICGVGILTDINSFLNSKDLYFDWIQCVLNLRHFFIYFWIFRIFCQSENRKSRKALVIKLDRYWAGSS